MPPDLDKFDRSLLDLLQRDADVSTERLAELVGLSASAVQRRIRRLKLIGVITATVAVVDPERTGNPSLFIVGLELERERAELLARLRSWIAAEDAIQQAHYVTGMSDLLLMILVPSVSDFDRFMARLLADNPNVRRFSTNVVLSTQKRQLLVPVLDEGSP